MSKLKHIIAALSLLCSLGQADAAKFVLSPVILTLNTAQGLTTSTTVTNTDMVPVAFTAEILSWSQSGGQDVLAPTRDALVSPASFTVAPGKSQVVRVALRRAPNTASATFRLVIKQVIQAPASSGTAVTITPRYVFSLPLFAEQATARPNVTLSATRRADGTYLRFKNVGTGYSVFRKMQLSAGNRVVDLGTQYVLGDSTMEVKVPAELNDAQTLGLTAEDADQKAVQVMVNVQP